MALIALTVCGHAHTSVLTAVKVAATTPCLLCAAFHWLYAGDANLLASLSNTYGRSRHA